MKTPILNPNNYLSNLTPADAFEFEVARNLYVAVLGATIWDILIYIPDDIRILRTQRSIRAVSVCFVTSRLFALCYIFLSVFAKTAPLDNCNPMFIAIGCCSIFSILSSSFLFLRRVQAVWAGNQWVISISTVLWVLDWGSEVVVPTGVRAAHIPNTRYCIDSRLKPYVLLGGIFPVVFDTFVFLAISYKIIIMHSTLDVRISWNTLVSGKALPRLSRAILKGGQQYYLINIGIYIIVLILLGLPSVPPVYQNMFAFPSVSLSASMACRVYRNIKLFDLDGETLRLPISDIKFSLGHSTSRYNPNTPYSTATQSTALHSRSKDTNSFIALDSIPTAKSHSVWSENPSTQQTEQKINP